MTTRIFRPASSPHAGLIPHLALCLVLFGETAGLAQSDPGILMVPTNGTSGRYTLSQGVLATAGTQVGPKGTFEQLGGTHAVAGALQVEGGVVLSGGGTAYAFYQMTDGEVISESLAVSVAVFTQAGGTNVTGALTIGPHNAQCTFKLSGGTLRTASTTLHGSWLGGIQHSAGTHEIEGRLQIQGDPFNRPAYVQTGGDVVAAELEIRQGTFRHQGGQVSIPGVVILEDGAWEEHAAEQSLGAIQLLGSSTSTIRLAGANTLLKIADSRALAWDSQARLVIEGWSGNLQGGGAQQILFGAGSPGLTAQQLNQISFKDPAGCAPGMYPARILPTGELAPGPFLNTIRNGGEPVLQWDNGVLQSATNPGGPFEDVVGAVSPHPLRGAEPQRFFRLRN
jgi:hypothetical protein